MGSIKNQKGSATLVMASAILVVGGLALTAALYRTESFGDVARTMQNGIESVDLKHALTILIGNKDVCTSSLQLENGNFRFGSSFIKDALFGNGYRLTDLRVYGGGSTGNGIHIANFVAKAERTHDSTAKIGAVVSAIYRMESGVITDCIVTTAAKEACEYFGMNWLENEARCDICESSGGVWENGVCRL